MADALKKDISRDWEKQQRKVNKLGIKRHMILLECIRGTQFIMGHLGAWASSGLLRHSILKSF